MKHLHPIFGGILSDTLGIEEKQDDKKKETEMKDQFIEKDGLLFLRCEPEPLEIDKHGKSLVRYIQDDTRMGLYNKEAVCEEKALEKVLLYEPRNIYIAGDHHTRFEVIAKHCPEGSREWALWKMLNGEMVHMSRFPYKALDGEIYCINSAGEIYPATSYQLWLENKAKDGWKIYEEPKFKAGDWLKSTHPDDHNYYKVIETYHKGIMPYAKLRGTAIAHWDTPLFETKSDGKHAPLFKVCEMPISIDGTPYWAWKQMAAGKKVHRVESSRVYRMNASGHAVDSANDYTYTRDSFFMIEHKNDWKVYEEPELKVGGWYKINIKPY